MKKFILTFLTLLFIIDAFGQADAVLTTKAGAKDNDLQSVLYFEGISYQKFHIQSEKLTGKNFQIIINEFKEGKLSKTDTAFNSHEDEYFRIKNDSLLFTVLTKMSDNNEFKIHFQFNGFSASKKYPVLPSEKDRFTLKSFFKPTPNNPISLNNKNYLLAYMMPYIRKDKSEAYCEVAQSGINPEKLYDTYKIPHYFLVQIVFD